MRLTDKQHEKLTEMLTHAMGVCECECGDKKCLFYKMTELNDADMVARVVKEIEKI